MITMNSISMIQIQKILGHSRLATTMRYALLTHAKRQPPAQPLELLPQPETSTQ